MFLERAKQRPDFNMERSCAGDVCSTVASATREPSRNADGNISYGQDVFLKYDKYPAHIVWCYHPLAGGPTHYRSCQQAPNFMWVEAYLPKSNVWAKIDLHDPSCSIYQLSQYDIDDGYADCEVRKLDKVEAPISRGVAPRHRQDHGVPNAGGGKSRTSVLHGSGA